MQRPTRRSRAARLQSSSSKTSRSRSSQSVSDGTEGPPNAANASSLFSGSRDFVINNSIIYGTQGVSDVIAQGIKALSERVIKGAAYDSSLRDPPPQCHPGTRVHLREKIVMWFNNSGRDKALLWLNGPAGVGKSAVVQTVAEFLAESNSIGATLFFSRLNDRNDSQRVFITLAFQLAIAIPAYRIYITERIALDPSLLEKGMKDQFRIFIAEPFGNKGIGRGEGPWAVLLDGLDECEGVDEQSKIVQLVGGFILAFPNAPFVWVIASRPEPHIVATFNDETVTPSYWSEYVPVDSTEACRDVERYLDASFKAMRKPFPHLPPNWPSETQFLKLTRGALGLFAFARTAVRFMEDPNHADPVSRLNILLSVIDRLDIKATGDHPFALLDALYTQIVTSIPPSVWCTTKRVLGLTICVQSRSFDNGFSYPLRSSNRTLTGASVILGIELSTTYGSLHKLHSVLNIPDSQNAHISGLTFFHASFGDYLIARARSKEFFIDRGESVDDITRGLFQQYLDEPWETGSAQYIPPLSMLVLHNDLRADAEDNLPYALTGELRSRRGKGPFKSQKDRSECLDALSKINPVDVYKLSGFTGRTILRLIGLWNGFREELEPTGLFKEVPLRDVKMGHLDCERNEPVFLNKVTPVKQLILFNEATSDKMSKRTITSILRERQLSHPERQVIIYGSLPEKRIAFFAGKNHQGDEGYFCFSYPH